jgi:hypothetical protein
VSIIVVFIIVALTIPANDTGYIGSLLGKYINHLKFSLPFTGNNFFTNINLPGWTKYAIILLFLLLFFDRALFRIFHKEHN